MNKKTWLWIVGLFLGFGTLGTALAIESRTFDGSIDFLNKQILFNLDLKEAGKLEVSGALSQEDKYNLKLALRHIKFGKSDLLSEFYASGEVLRSAQGRAVALKGKAWSQASLLNFKPLKEFSADYELNPSALTFNSFSWADIDIRGEIKRCGQEVIFNHPLFNLSLSIKEMELKDLAGLLGISPEDVEIEGKVSGEVKISGPKEAVKIEARLTAAQGMVNSLKFNSAKLDMEGIWPVLRFVNAQVNDVGGVIYELKGQFSLKEISNFGSSQHQVKVYSANNAMRLEDWIIRRQSDNKEQDSVEAEYPLKNNQALKMRIKNQEETLGWEKSIKF